MYSSEVWSYSVFGENNFKRITTENLEKLYNHRTSPLEKVALKFYKALLHLPPKTSNTAPYGELGVYPLYIDCISRTLKYWYFIENKSSNILLKEALDCDKDMHNKGIYTWFSFINNIMTMSKLSVKSGYTPSIKDIKLIKNKLQKRYVKYWINTIKGVSEKDTGNSKKLRTYSLFKTHFNTEKYLSVIKNREWKTCLTKFRLSAHNLMIETGRHYNMKVEDRLCKHCDSSKIEDEKHFLLECAKYDALRQNMMQKLYTHCPKFNQLNQTDQLCWIMSCTENDIIYALAEYLFKATESINAPS